MENMRSFPVLLAAILSIVLSLTPVGVESVQNRLNRPKFDFKPPHQQPGGPRPPWPPQPPQNAPPQNGPPNSPWNRGPQQPQPPPQQPFRPQQSAPPPPPPPPPPAPPSSMRDFGKPAKSFQSFNEIPVDEVVKAPEPVKAEEKILDAVDKLSEEIVEAVVERLEEDEALAIELEREGFDPNVYSTTTRPTATVLLLLTICVYFITST